MNAYGESLFGGGSFFGQSVSADGTYRKVTFGEFDMQHERGAGTTLSFNGRMAWERAAGEDAMVAYFLGAEVNSSNLEGTYTGDQKRYGLTAGVYGFKELENNLYLSGYGSLGVARSDLDITDGASSVVTGDYTSRTMSLGGKLSGSVDYETYELRPSVSLNFVKTWIGDITLDESGSSVNVAVGDTTFGELVAKPEFLFPMEQQAGSNMVTVASAAPRLICERSDAANTVTKDCGAGLELGINGTSEDGATNLNASIRFDRVGGVDRQGLNLQAEFRF
ncbi:autotransporter outer membrane beta-barrel domain-containing protein [Paradonghicola geojensis]|nr:autotransporter outer membrane beta-barrel domain-containing protein [Marivivens geojensis]